MRYVKVRYDDREMWGVLQEDEVRLLVKPPFSELCYEGTVLPLDACRLAAPCEATKIVCVGKNYYDHIEEMRSMFDASHNPERPEGAVHAPDFVGRLDYDGELGVVIKRRAKNVSEADALDYVLGYTCLNDITARDIQKEDGQWTRGKNMDGFAPMGPVVTDEVDPAHLDIMTRLNGSVVQHSSTELLITSVRKIIAFITASMTLEPGDVIATGTPAGVGPMVPGDVVEVEIGGIGVLRNHIV